jgi:(p)ppGpp synthase/HD superfamily hydrolase
MNPQIEKARLFATAAHAAIGQKRKYTFEPYIVHPEEVAKIVHEAGGTPEMVCAAYLHDVLEDTQVDRFTLLKEFGPFITDMVIWMTKVEVPGNRAVRKAAELIRLAGAPNEVQTIKLADLISNTPTIVKYDPDFAVVYMREKKELIAVLTRGDRGLLDLAHIMLDNWKVE